MGMIRGAEWILKNCLVTRGCAHARAHMLLLYLLLKTADRRVEG